MNPSQSHPSDPFAGPGEVRALARSRDWSATSLGPVERWSPTLRTAVRTVLASPFPLNLWCGEDMVLIYNDDYAPILGAKHPDALGRPGQQVWAEIWDEVAPMFAQIREGGPPVYADDAPFVVERPGQEEAWFTFSLSPVHDEDGHLVAFFNVVSETTSRVLAERAREAARAQAERAEARLLEIFAQAPAFMAVLRGPDHVFEYANRAYYELVGHRQLIGLSVFEALPEVRDQGFEDLLDSVLETGETFVGREVSVRLFRGSDGPEERYVDFVYYPIREQGEATLGVVAHGSDVTDHVRHRMEAQKARAQAEEANKAKSQFLATMSHELRTPINAIIGYAQLLEMGVVGPVTDAQKAQLARVRGSSDHLLMLIDDILDLTKVEAGRMEVKREPVPVVSTVADAVGLVSPQARKREIDIDDRCGDLDPVSCEGDPARVRQILANVLSNAVKFTPPGGTIRVRCGVGQDGARAFISVSDTGIGIASDALESIFEPFTQAEPAPGLGHAGTGLGLAISRRLARLMGGDLTVESVVGEGSTFTLWLPTASGEGG